MMWHLTSVGFGAAVSAAASVAAVEADKTAVGQEFRLSDTRP